MFPRRLSVYSHHQPRAAKSDIYPMRRVLSPASPAQPVQTT